MNTEEIQMLVNKFDRGLSGSSVGTHPELSSVESNLSRDYDVTVVVDTEEILYRHEKGVELALHRAKVWSKYTKDLLSFIEKKCQMSSDFARNQMKLNTAIKPILNQESFLPFQTILNTAIDHELEMFNQLSLTSNLIHTTKFVQPLSIRRCEHEKQRRAIKEVWHKQLKRLTETVNALKKAKLVYVQRNQEFVRLVESLQKTPTGEQMEKLEKKRDDMALKVREASGAYALAVKEANEEHAALQTGKKKVLQKARELVMQADVTMKQTIVTYFQLQHSLTNPLPLQSV